MARAIRIADRLLSMRTERRVVTSLEEPPNSLDEAYHIQDLLVHELVAQSDGYVIGYKVAATSAAAQRLLQVDSPFFGRLMSDTSFTSPATLSAGRFTVRCIEAEFGVEIGDTPPEGRDYTRESIAEFVSAVIPAIEVVDHRYTDWSAVGAPSLIADNAIHGAWIEANPVTRWRGTDLEDHELALSLNGRVVSKGSGAAVLGHPLNVVAWLANELPRYGHRLRRGDKITTGTAAPVYFAEAGDRVIADFGEFGHAQLNFVE